MYHTIKTIIYEHRTILYIWHEITDERRVMRMKALIMVLCLVAGIGATVVVSEEMPRIVLDKGTNEIPVTVVNKLGRDITGLTVDNDRNSLPDWLSVEGTLRSIDVEGGEKGTGQFVLIMTVTDAPQGAEALVPFTLKDAAGNRWSFTTRVSVEAGEPVGNALFVNYPNPFNPSTTIRYSLKESSNATLAVYNSLGQKIRTLVDGSQAAGVHTVQWDGRNESGQQVSSGVYFYRLQSGTFRKTMKMVLFE